MVTQKEDTINIILLGDTQIRNGVWSVDGNYIALKFIKVKHSFHVVQHLQMQNNNAINR